MRVYKDRGTKIGALVSKSSVTDPSNPTVIGTLLTKEIKKAKGLFVSNNYAYIIGEGLTIVDVSNPASPQVVGRLVGTKAIAIYVSGSYAYLAGKGLIVVYVSNPSNPQVVGNLMTKEIKKAKALYISGDYAYIAGKGLAVVDVSDSTTPRTKDLLPIQKPSKVWGGGGFVYVVDKTGKLTVVDVSMCQ